MERLEAGRAQDRLAQPLQPEHQQQPAHHDAQDVDRQRGERRPERCDQRRERHDRRAHPRQRGGPAARRADGEDDRQRLDRLDRAGEEDRDGEAELGAADPSTRGARPAEAVIAWLIVSIVSKTLELRWRSCDRFGNAPLTRACSGEVIVSCHQSNSHAEEITMTHESYKAWLDEMPIDDVRRRIERLERKLEDLHMLERLYDERHGGEADAEAAAGEESEESGEEPELGEAEHAPEAGAEEHVEEHEHPEQEQG